MLQIWTFFAERVVEFVLMLDSIPLFGTVTFFGFFIGLTVFSRLLRFLLYVVLDFDPAINQSVNESNTLKFSKEQKDSFKKSSTSGRVRTIAKAARPSRRRSKK